jgi:predicted kinase
VTSDPNINRTVGPQAVRISRPAVVVLVGPSGSGKSAWAAENFADSEVVSSDRLRAVTGTGESDLNASEDAFILLRQIVSMRCKKGLTSVVDTLGFDADLRHWLIGVAVEADLQIHAVVFDTPARLCKERNAIRTKRVSVAVLSAQMKKFTEVRAVVLSEPFASVHTIQPSDSPSPGSPTRPVRSPTEDSTASQSAFGVTSDRSKRPVRFGLQLQPRCGIASSNGRKQRKALVLTRCG